MSIQDTGDNARGAGGRPEARFRIGSTDHWDLYLNGDQNLLGRCFFMLKRNETDVAALTEAEVVELWEATRRIKTALLRLWDPDHFNFAFLMNQTPQVHWHIIPRYRNRREFAGGTFVDPEFGGHYGIGPARHLDPAADEAIVSALRRAF